MSPVKLKGAHRVVASLAGGRVAIYWYRRRGQRPAMVTFEGASITEALRAEADGVAAIVQAYEAAPEPPPAQTVRDLVTLYKHPSAADGWKRVAESTRATWSPWLDAIITEFGDLPVAALGVRGVRGDIIAWRDTFSHTPRAADTGMQVINRLFNWALNRELIEKNPAAGIEGIYSANRADVIVEPHEVAAVLQHASLHARLAIRLARSTGLRRGDLIDLRWAEVQDFAIDRAANKSTTGRRLVVPLYDEAREVIAELRALNKAAKVPSTYVLTSSRGTPWQKDGLGISWWRAAQKAGVDKHFNDLRGTACTMFCRVPLTDEEVADIMAWEPERVRNIRKRYVDRNRLMAGIIARIEKAEKTK